MAELTAEQLDDVQADLDIGTAQDVFTDDELHRLYTRALADFSDLNAYLVTVALGWQQMVATASKRARYTQGVSREDLDRVYEQMKDRLQDARQTAGLGGGRLTYGFIKLQRIEGADETT